MFYALQKAVSHDTDYLARLEDDVKFHDWHDDCAVCAARAANPKYGIDRCVVAMYHTSVWLDFLPADSFDHLSRHECQVVMDLTAAAIERVGSPDGIHRVMQVLRVMNKGRTRRNMIYLKTDRFPSFAVPSSPPPYGKVPSGPSRLERAVAAYAQSVKYSAELGAQEAERREAAKRAAKAAKAPAVSRSVCAKRTCAQRIQDRFNARMRRLQTRQLRIR